MTDDLSKETSQGAADIVFDTIAFGPGICGLVVTSKKDNGIPWGGVGIVLEYYDDVHHVEVGQCQRHLAQQDVITARGALRLVNSA
jgi:hypothetical protein